MFCRWIVFIVCGVILIGGWSSTGSAAMHFLVHPHPHPYFYPYPYYYDYGGWGAFASAYEIAAQRRAFGLDRQLQLESSLAQNADWRSINQSLQVGALLRRPAPIDGGQAARDWLYQMQRRVSPEKTASPPTSLSREIMLWPTLLRGEAFTALRNQVEAPFRRAYAENKSLTADDYQGIIQSLEAMKMTLRTLESQVLESEYAIVEDYLDNLLGDARKRREARAGEKER